MINSRNKRCYRKFSILFAVLLLSMVVCNHGESCSFSTEKGQPGHKEIWYYCLGVPKDFTAEKLTTILKYLSYNCMDFESNSGDRSPAVATIRKLSHGKFNWGDYGHRIFFHWGYYTDIRSSIVWGRVWKQHILPGFSSKEKQVEDLLRGTWNDRKDKLQSMLITRLQLSGLQAADFAALLCNIHLLSDHIYSANIYTHHALAPLRDIRKELIRSIKCLFSPEQFNTLGVEKKLQIPSDYSVPDAKNMLDAVSDLLPDLLLSEPTFSKLFSDLDLEISKEKRNSSPKPW